MRMRRPFMLLLLLALCGSCAETAVREEAADPVAEPRSGDPAPARTTFVAGRSVRGREIPCHVLGDGHDVCMIIATIHGNEAAGTPLVAELERHLLGNPEVISGRKIVIVPVANPDGMASNRRTNVNGVDLNRNFPADNFRGTSRHGAAPLSEPESRALRSLIYRFAPSRVVSIHQPVACIDWDGPAEGLARAMAAECDLPARRIGSRPGSMGSWVGVDLKIPIITLELPRAADRLDASALWQRYGKMMLAAVSWND